MTAKPSGFASGDSLADAIDRQPWTAGEIADEAVERQSTFGVWSNHKRTLRTAERTAGKVAAHRTNGNGLAVTRYRSTVGDHTRRISRSAERQYFDAVDAADRRVLGMIPAAW